MVNYLYRLDDIEAHDNDGEVVVSSAMKKLLKGEAAGYAAVVGAPHRLRRHCEPTGRRKAPPDDRLREAIHRATEMVWIASSLRSSQ
jgi:hypothetical protein